MYTRGLSRRRVSDKHAGQPAESGDAVNNMSGALGYGGQTIYLYDSSVVVRVA